MEKDSVWHRMVLKISEETSFHGVRQISEPQRFVIRRVLWSLIVLASSAILILQVVLNIQSFILWPVSVDIKINYNDSVVFPAITICNFNSFRATAAYDKGYYDLLSDLYSGDESFVQSISNSYMGLTLDMLNRETGHRLEDLVVSCTWEGSPCNESDFKVSLTEFGQCYTFNSGEDYQSLYKAVITGSSGGLSLQLNVEQYQYMIGPNEGAGLKVLVHQNDVDGAMKDHGLAIPPGAHAYVAAKIIEIHNMEPEHGNCSNSVNLEFHQVYSVDNCYSECRQKYLLTECGCREFYMPDIDGWPEVCTLGQHLTCGRKAMDEFSIDEADCFCPVPCDSRMYETVSSFASTSNFDIESLLRSNLTSVLQEKFITSREINSQADRSMREDFHQLLNEFQVKAKLLEGAMQAMNDTLQKVEDLMNAMLLSRVKPANFHVNRGFELLLYNLQSNYIQVWENYKMTSYDVLPTGYLDLEMDIVSRVNIFSRKATKFVDYTVYDGLSANATAQMKYRKLVLLPIEEILLAKSDVMELAFNHTDNVANSIDFPDPNPGNVITKNGRYDHTLNTRTILLNGVITSTKNRLFRRMKNLRKGMRGGISDYMNFIRSYVIDGGRFRRWKLPGVTANYHEAEMTFNTLVSQLEEHVVYQPLRAISEKRDTFKSSNRTIGNLASNLMRDLRKSKQSLEDTYNTHWTTINFVMDMAHKYMSNFQVKKIELAKIWTSNKTQVAISEIIALLKDTRNQIQSLHDELDNLHQALRLMWVDVKTEPLTYALYDSMRHDINAFLSDDYVLKDDLLLEMIVWIVGQGQNENELANKTLSGKWTKEELVDIAGRDLFLTPLPSIHENLMEQYKEIGNILDSVTNMTGFGGYLENAYHQLKQDCELFLQDNIIGTDFYRENFVRLDIYMQELRYEEITQQEAYSVIQLIGDMGGSMGLFVGGSLLSVIEVFDIFIHQCTKSLLKKK